MAVAHVTADINETRIGALLDGEDFTDHLLELAEEFLGLRANRCISRGVDVHGSTEASCGFVVDAPVFPGHLEKGLAHAAEAVMVEEQEFLHVTSSAHGWSP